MCERGVCDKIKKISAIVNATVLCHVENCGLLQHTTQQVSVCMKYEGERAQQCSSEWVCGMRCGIEAEHLQQALALCTRMQ